MLWPTKGTGLLHVANNNKLKKALNKKKQYEMFLVCDRGGSSPKILLGSPSAPSSPIPYYYPFSRTEKKYELDIGLHFSS